MRKITLSASAVVGALVLVGLAIPASAADGATTTTVEVQAGALSISTPASLSPTGVAPGATATGTLSGVAVTDATADTIGWTTTASITVLTGTTAPAETIAATEVDYSAGTAVVTGTATVTAGAKSAIGTATAVQTASAVTGNNTATWDATVDVAVPSDALADSYTATLTHSVS